jgi:BRCA1 C Terminus (BRCT) domain
MPFNTNKLFISQVENVWKKSQNLEIDVRADDTHFDVYKLPIFFDVCVTSTGLKTQDRSEIKAILENNGGNYSSSLTAAVDILILDKESIGSQKFNDVVKLKKHCLSTAWISDSLKNGYAMHVDNYTLSRIETEASSSRIPTVFSIVQDFKKILIDAKKFGKALSGCNILLSGFSAVELPLISEIVSVLGATKMDSINEQVTHVIIGTLDPQLFADLDKHKVVAPVLKVKWLKSIVERKMLVEKESDEAAAQLPLDSEREVGSNNRERHRLVFAITGIQEKQVKAELIEKIRKLGAEYVEDCGNLTQLTHLISLTPIRSEILYFFFCRLSTS